MTVHMKNSEKFEASLNLDMLSVEDVEIQQRRIAFYSVDALRAAIAIDKIYLSHPDFKRSLNAMDRIFQLSREMDMAQGMLLSGPTGVGKTAVFKYFRDSLPASNLFAPGYGALGLRCPKRPTVGFFVGALLRAYKYPFSNGSEKQLYARREIVFDAIEEKKTRLMFIDESGGLLNARTETSTQYGETDVSDFIREMIDRCRMGVVLATPSPIDSLDELDSGLASRLTVRQTLREFKPDVEWLGVLSAFTKQCNSYDLSFIQTPVIANDLHKATNGNLRMLKRFMVEAVLIGVDSGKMALDQEIFATAFDLIFGNSGGRTNVFK